MVRHLSYRSAVRQLLLAIAIGLAAGPLAAAERIALVIGNQNYGAVTPLDNPVSDARLMAQSLEATGFDVRLITDGTIIELKRAIAQFGRDLRSAGSEATGLFYYAGHGVQSFGTNYLIPVDAELTDAADLGLVGVEAEAVLRQMASARNKTNIVILDACRDNPFESIPDMDDNGLAEMKAPTGTFLAYSTSPGAVALDGLGANSPFTQALATRISEPGLPIEQLFKSVRVDVLDQTRGQQTPWDTSSLTAPFTFVAAPTVSAEERADRQLWESVRGTRDAVQIMLFMRSYPNSNYIDNARDLLAEVLTEELTSDAGSQTAETAPASPVQDVPDPREQEMIDAAQASGLASDYQAYLDAFPGGTYAELAAFEIATISASEAAKRPAPEVLAAVPAETAPPDTGVITFSSPIVLPDSDLSGLSIEELVLENPLHPPIEGLLDVAWKGQSCAACHNWTRDALCTQANTYVTAQGARALDKPHPFGGGFKLGLRDWAENGCQ